MAKRVIQEDPISHERWLVSYADFLTLMLAFFVVMYSVSQVSESKYRVLSNTLTAAFNVPEMSIKPIQTGEPVLGIPGEVNPDLDVVGEEDSVEVSGGPESGQPQLPEEFQKISTSVEDQFSDLMDQQLISVQGNEEWLEIELKSGMLFGSGNATPSDQAGAIITELADIVRDSPLPIRVEGFTDNVPIATNQFASNWELSSARATSIVKLLADAEIDPARLAAIGYGEHQPVSDNSTPEGRASNRRVTLMISRYANLRPDLPRPEQIAEPVPEAVVDEQTDVIMVELEDGRILFTSDPARAEELRQQQATPDPQ